MLPLPPLSKDRGGIAPVMHLRSGVPDHGLIKSSNFFLSWRRFVVLTAVTSVSEVIVNFLQLILFANIAGFFYSLLGLVPHSF